MEQKCLFCRQNNATKIIKSKRIRVLTGFYLVASTHKIYKFSNLKVCNSCYIKDIIVKSLLIVSIIVTFASFIFLLNSKQSMAGVQIFIFSLVQLIVFAFVHYFYNSSLLKKLKM